MCVLDLNTLHVDTLWNQNMGGSVSFSPDDSQLLITGAPNLFGELGVNLTNAEIPNIYDNQAYIYTIETKEFEAISKDFNPSIGNSYWSKTQDIIYFTTTDKTYSNLYAYDLNSNIFSHIKTGEDLVQNISFAKNENMAAYVGVEQTFAFWMQSI